MIIPVKTSQGKYDIILERGALSKADELLNLDRRVLIVTDTGVPEEYAKTIASFCKTPVIFTFPQGEESKSFDTLKTILSVMVENNFTRSDCVVATGGGVAGDMAGFAASMFMRGVEFYNIPTTFLSCVDSSVGGKTAVDFMGIKNIVGAFYPPSRVIIDPNTLKTLSARHLSAGIAESVKMAATSDKELFESLETCDISDTSAVDFIIARSLLIKKKIVEADEKESGLRRVLNFGHTLAHAIESGTDFGFYHGECVALGMLPMSSDKVRTRLESVLKRFSLPTEYTADTETLIALSRHDKKMSSDTIFLVTVEEIGSFKFLKIPFEDYEKMIREQNI